MLTINHANRKRIILTWCLYDWACSAFPVVITTFVFATYFTTRVAANPIVGTYQWGSATAIAGFLIAMASPIFGAIADYSGGHKRWLIVMTSLCVFGTVLLWFVLPAPAYVNFAMGAVILATVSLEIAVVFYNSYLPHLVSSNYIGRLSGWAWGIGYFGGIGALSLTLFGFINSPPHWLDTSTAEQIRICGPLTALWFAIFAFPFLVLIPETHGENLFPGEAIRRGIKELWHTLKSLPNDRRLLLFLLAHLIYIDGLNTLFAFGGIYAAGTFHMPLTQVILFGIAMNVSAGIGAVLLAWVDDYLGSKATILISLVFLILFGFSILLVQDIAWFWILGLALSVFLGPVQSASRSLMARIAPANKSTELFGLYAFSGKITAFLGPWILGVVTFYFKSQRAGMATVLFFFFTGGVILLFVKEKVQEALK